MLTSLDLLVIFFMILAAATLLSLCLMFLIRNKTARKVFFYITLVLGLLVSCFGLLIGISGFFTEQIAVALLTAVTCIGAFVFERISKGNEKRFLIARIASAAALVIGFLNAIY